MAAASPLSTATTLLTQTLAADTTLVAAEQSAWRDAVARKTALVTELEVLKNKHATLLTASLHISKRAATVRADVSGLEAALAVAQESLQRATSDAEAVNAELEVQKGCVEPQAALCSLFVVSPSPRNQPLPPPTPQARRHRHLPPH